MLVYTFNPDVETITPEESIRVIQMLIASFSKDYIPCIQVSENLKDTFEELLGPALRHFTIDK